MTQQERLTALFKEFGIEPIENPETRGNGASNFDIILHEGIGNVYGHTNFYCLFRFDKQGNFISVGVWE